MSTLTTILDHIGFAPRQQQIELYSTLAAEVSQTGVVAQAGTGTGKSIAVLAAAYDWRQNTDKPTLVICPTNILLDQYLSVDAPRVSEALGCAIKSLKGRNRYLCVNAPGFSGVGRLPDEVIAQEVEMNERLNGPDIYEPENTYWFGCPGSDECSPETGEGCHYRRSKHALADADIIVTNAHLLIINDQLRAKDPIEKEGDDGEVVSYQPSIFPEHGAVFVDEAHTLEDNLRSFATRSIPLGAVDGLGLADWLRGQARSTRDPATIVPDLALVQALREAANQPLKDADGNTLKKHQREAKEAAAFMLARGEAKAYAENEAVLWFDPQEYPKKPRLVSTQINLAGGARRILTSQPFGLVSGTVPKTMRGSLGISDAEFIDVGHPFDYGKQVTLKISSKSGSFKATKQQNNQEIRADEVLSAVLQAKGGALCLFASYRDMESIYMQIRLPLIQAGLEVRMQSREGDKKALGQWFKDHGNAVLFGTESFATGFDVPGDALRLVVIWKVPYPGLDPVTKAISARDRRRYEDMALMKITQAAGRLIRTSTDTGTIFIADSRAENLLLGQDDPMIQHFDEMAMKAKRSRGWDET